MRLITWRAVSARPYPLALGAACLTAGFLPRLVANALAGEQCDLQPVGHLSRACEAGNGAMVRWVGLITYCTSFSTHLDYLIIDVYVIWYDAPSKTNVSLAPCNPLQSSPRLLSLMASYDAAKICRALSFGLPVLVRGQCRGVRLFLATSYDATYSMDEGVSCVG